MLTFTGKPLWSHMTLARHWQKGHSDFFALGQGWIIVDDGYYRGRRHAMYDPGDLRWKAIHVYPMINQVM